MSTLADRLSADVIPYLPWILLALGLLLAAFGVVLLLVARKARLRGESLDPDDPDVDEDLTLVDLRAETGSDLRRSFRHARSRLRRTEGLYAQPWILQLGESAAGKTTLLEHLSLPQPFGEPLAQGSDGGRKELGWWVFGSGVVLDVPGAWVLRRDGLSSDHASWLDFLRLLRESRPRRPVDGVVLVIPADHLIPGDDASPSAAVASLADLQAEAARRGRRLFDKLDQVRRRLGMAVPVHAVVTRCDRMTGFRDLIRQLPGRLDEEMLGWSNPAPPQAPYQDRWIADALDTVEGSLGRLRSTGPRPAEGDGGGDRDDPLAVAAEAFNGSLERARPILQVYLNQIFARGSGGDPTLALRGLYFCGASFEGDRSAGEAGAGDPTCARPFPQVGRVPRDVLFGADLFRRRVFPEGGVGRPTGSAVGRNHRRRLRLQAALVILPLLLAWGLTHDQRKVASEAEALEPLVRSISEDLFALRGAGAGSGRPAPEAGDGPSPEAGSPAGEPDLPQEPLAESGEEREGRVVVAGLPGRGSGSGPVAAGWVSETTTPRGVSHRGTSSRTAASPPQPAALRAEAARQLVAGSRGVERYDLRSPFLPASWWGGLDRRLERVFVAGYEGIVFPALDRHLLDQERSLEEISTAFRPPTGPAYPEETPAFRRLAAFLGLLGRVEEDAAAYRCIARGCGPDHRVSGPRLLADFRRLTRDAWKLELSTPTLDAERFYGRVLKRLQVPARAAERLDSSATQRRLRDKTRELFGNLYLTLFHRNTLLDDLALLERELEILENPFSPAARASSFRALDRQISRTRGVVSRPEYEWMVADTLDLGAPVEVLWAAVGASLALGPALEARLEEEAQREFRGLQPRLAAFSSAATGPLLARENDRVQLKLSDGVEAADKAVEGFLGESFMEPGDSMATPPPARSGGGAGNGPGGADGSGDADIGGAGSPRDAPPGLQPGPAEPRAPGTGERFAWQLARLEAAAALFPDFGEFQKKGIEAFPPQLRATTEEVALANLRRHVLQGVARAQVFSPLPPLRPPQTFEQDLGRRAGSLEDALKPLEEILDGFARLRMRGARRQVLEVLRAQERNQLQDSERLLAREDLYAPAGGDFSSWDGLQPPAPEAFGASSGQALSAYLQQQLAIARRLAQDYAGPALTAADRWGGEDTVAFLDLEAEWRGILTALEELKDQKAGNAVSGLQDLISSTLTATDLGGCFALVSDLPAGDGRSPEDYFDRRRERLLELLGQRCTDLAAGYGRACYGEMAEIFGERLAGTYPFARQETLLLSPGATPAALRDFYGVYDRSAWLVPQVPEARQTFAPHEAEARAFLGEMGQVRTLLAPFLEQPKKYPVPTLGFTVDFRVNREGERGADQVLRWELEVDGTTYRRGGGAGAGGGGGSGGGSGGGGSAASGGAWALGQPVTLTLGWAQDAPVEPYRLVERRPPTSKVGRLEGPDAVWQYRNPWSLLGLLRDHPSEPSDFPAYAEPAPTVLKVLVETASRLEAGRDGERETPGKTQQARLFLRIGLLTPDREEPLELPETFPVEAPEVATPVGEWGCPADLPQSAASPSSGGASGEDSGSRSSEASG